MPELDRGGWALRYELAGEGPELVVLTHGFGATAETWRGQVPVLAAAGYPSLHLLAPSGEVIGIYKTYRPGQEDFVWGQLKQGVSLAQSSQKSWRASLEKKGYRNWSNDSGKVVFARLGAYHEGQMILVEPDGQRIRTHEKSLSAGDRVWIQDEKRRRGIQ